MSPSRAPFISSRFSFGSIFICYFLSLSLFFSSCLIEVCFSLNLKSASSLQCGHIYLPPSCFCVFTGHMVFELRHLWLFMLFHSSTMSSLSGYDFSLQNKVSGFFSERLAFYLDGFQAGAPVAHPRRAAKTGVL